MLQQETQSERAGLPSETSLQKVSGAFSETLAAAIVTAQVVDNAASNLVAESFADTLAVSVAGSEEPVVHALYRFYGRSSESEHQALIGAVKAHALDYDDVHLKSGTHLSAVVVPALMACESKERAAGYVAATIAADAIGQVLGAGHYAKGWHATSTIGPLLAAAAVARARRLDSLQTRRALSLAVAQAAGMQRNFGTMAKPLQAGMAAAAGLRAALWAENGVTADEAPFGEKGFFDLYGTGLTVDPDTVQMTARPSGLSRKLYPCCYASHRMIAAVLEARKSCGSPQVDGVHVRTPAGTLQALRISDPADQNEAKFCAKYILACAWLDGAVTLGHFSRLSIQREDVRVMMGRIEIEEEPSPGTDIERGTVSVIITGQPLSITNQKHFPGSPAWPASAEQLWAKIDDCLVASGKTAEQLRNEVKKLLCW